MKKQRSPWTGKTISISALHAVELSHYIREMEIRHNFRPLRMQGWTRQRMEEYLDWLLHQ